MNFVLPILLFFFIAGLAFAPAQELAAKVKTAAQVAFFAVVLWGVWLLLFVRVISDR